jgi:glutathione synthase/RimK-type ligase-like ATP-grasp enzyme
MSGAGLVLNLPAAISVAADKLKTYTALKEASINVPPFTTNTDTAAAWSADGKRVLARQILNGHSGAGIVDIDPGTSDISPAPVYCEYLKKRHEYRIHVVGSTVTDVQAKRRKTSVPASEVNWHIRSNDNGFVFCRQDLDLSPATKEVAIQAIQALDLDFGAVDVILHDSRPYVLEVNTAPGLYPTSVANYAAAFLTLIEARTHA